MNSLISLKQYIEHARSKLLNHPIYRAVDSKEKLRLFMQAHVFAVWDFMSLVKRLQQDLTCVKVPWTPPRSPAAARLINEIVLVEESDLGLDGKPISHFELYLAAMEEIQANTQPIRAFVRGISEGIPLRVALEAAEAPQEVQAFVTETLSCAQNATAVEVAAAFLFGREDLIPEMFRRLLKNWDEQSVPYFAYYLHRHISIDGETHGPQAERLLQEIAGTDARAWRLAGETATRAIEARIKLWDSIVRSISPQSNLQEGIRIERS